MRHNAGGHGDHKEMVSSQCSRLDNVKRAGEKHTLALIGSPNATRPNNNGAATRESGDANTKEDMDRSYPSHEQLEDENPYDFNLDVEAGGLASQTRT